MEKEKINLMLVLLLLLELTSREIMMVQPDYLASGELFINAPGHIYNSTKPIVDATTSNTTLYFIDSVSGLTASSIGPFPPTAFTVTEAESTFLPDDPVIPGTYSVEI